MNPFSRVFPLLALLAAAAGQNEAARPADKPPAAKAPFVFEPGTVELRTLIERCGTYLHRNILADDSELLAAANAGRKAAPPRQAAAAGAAPETVAGPMVELQLPVVTDRNGCEELLTSLLWSRGLALVPLDEPKGVYEVLSMVGPRAREITMRAVPRTPDEVLARPTLRQFVTVVQPLKHTNAMTATNALRPFFASSGNPGIPSLSLGNAGNSTSVLLSGPQDQVANAIMLLQTADVPQPPEAHTELEARLDALAKQQEQLLRRLATLEDKVGKKE